MSGPGLIKHWIQEIEHETRNRQPRVPRDPFMRTAPSVSVRLWHRIVDKLQIQCNQDVKDGHLIQELVYYLESLCARSQPGLAGYECRGLPRRATLQKSTKATKEHIENLRDVCMQLETLCRVEDDASDRIRTTRMFNRSYAFGGLAMWMHLLQHEAFNIYQDASRFAFIPTERTIVPSERCITMQSTYIGTVLHVGPRMLGWSDRDASIRTIAQWLQICEFRGGSQEILHIFARTLLGGFCREHRARSVHECLLLEWLAELNEDIHISKSLPS